jgi:hypothetical protein
VRDFQPRCNRFSCMQTMHFPQGCHRKAKHPGMTGVFLIITLPLRGYFLRGTFGTALEGLRGAVFSATAALGSSLFAEASGSGLPDLEGPLPPDGLRVVFAVAACSALLELAEQQLVGERLLDVFLDHPAQRPGTHLLVIALVGKPGDGVFGQVEGDVALIELGLKLHDELLHHHAHHLPAAGWPNGMMASRRLRNSGVNSRLIASESSPSRFDEPKPMAALAMSDAPALVVMIRITLRKSIDLPLWSVSLP